MGIEFKKHLSFWVWIGVAFFLGIIVGVVLFIMVLIILQAMISYAG